MSRLGRELGYFSIHKVGGVKVVFIPYIDSSCAACAFNEDTDRCIDAPVCNGGVFVKVRRYNEEA